MMKKLARHNTSRRPAGLDACEFMEATSRELFAATAEETRHLGVRLGRALAAGDVVALVGPLGSGKTTFAQGVAEGLEVPAARHVASPTFALVNEHPGRVPFVHADLYRIERPEELRELGLEAGYDQAATAIEWADRFPGVIPADHLEIRFTAMDAGRRLVARAAGPRGGALLAAL
jgi:tRNA threonylcarbamoyladenosine biosynthesis protein TsaE